MIRKIFMIFTILVLMVCMKVQQVDANGGFKSDVDLSAIKEKELTEFIPIFGWVFHESKSISEVELLVDGMKVTNIPYGLARSDVLRAFPNFKQAENSGLSLNYSLANTTIGEHTISINAKTSDNEIYQIASCRFIKGDIILKNLESPAIDIVSFPLHDLNISGWVFNSEGIKETNIYLDDNKIGSAEYGIRRTDVKLAYPEYKLSENSGFLFKMKTDQIKEGNHTVKLSIVVESGSEKEIWNKTLYKKNLPEKNNHTMLYTSLVLILILVIAYRIMKKKYAPHI